MRKKRSKKSKLVEKKKKADEEVETPVKASSVKAAHSKQPVSYPLPFTSGLKYPRKAFLRNEPPYEESFQEALSTSYEGFVVDDPNEMRREHHSMIEHALQTMDKAGFFRVDMTQPFGLGTKCAKTYVTRCLVGEAGNTYKYLGLRMFAHPWKSEKAIRHHGPEIHKALSCVKMLNDALAERTKQHLAELDKKRKVRGDAPTRGIATFDVALINCMESPEGLKDEPTTGEGKCSVSWHADSSLEHYSTIAVYHLLSKESNESGKWSVGLRVAHNSEGPGASRRGTDISVVEETPPIAVSLPSRSSYYLLDDFNHHHQHAVIAEGKVPGRRFSSTHRLLRESHNVNHMLARCKACCAGFHKKGPKVWRSEQLLLTEMESEWLRQFFVQGKAHHTLLWGAWEDPINELLKHWTQLEERTKQTTDWLQAAAEGKCNVDTSSSELATGGPPPTRAVRKLREKRKKARDGMQELLARGEEDGGAQKLLYEPMATLLEERAKMRELWVQREKDGTFHEVDKDNRPMSLPFDFAKTGTGNRPVDRGWSPLQGEITELRRLANDLRCWGRAYESGSQRDLPTDNEGEKKVTSDEHCKPFEWSEWGIQDFALEMQDPWAEFLLRGKKSIETRAYPLPSGLIGRKIEILQSSRGKAGVSSLSDTINLSDGSVKKVGWCKFNQIVEYRDLSSFQADESKHLVKRDSGYGWVEGSTLVMYGWIVGEYGTCDPCEVASDRATRRLRSLFQLHTTLTPSSKRLATTDSSDQNRRKKKRRKKK